MSPAERQPQEHQVGITNAQEGNPDAEISRLTQAMNTLFAAKQYGEAARLALLITERSKDELVTVFRKHGVAVLHLDHEAFGIFDGQIEPTYDTVVDGPTQEVLAAAVEFGTNHAQKMILVARKMHEGDSNPDARLGLSVSLNATITIDEAVLIAELVRTCGFQGATFAPKRNGEVAIYHTDLLGMTSEAFVAGASNLVHRLKTQYRHLTDNMQKFILHMPRI
jgi:hypothetical protein